LEDNKHGARYAENIVTWEISDATPISATHVSLGPKNESVRAALSQEFREYLKGLHMWLEHIANLHHAVADEVAYKDFETKMSENIKRTSQTTIDSRRNLGRFSRW